MLHPGLCSVRCHHWSQCHQLGGIQDHLLQAPGMDLCRPAQILFGVMLQLQQLQPYAVSSLKLLPGLLRKAQMCITILSQIFSRDNVKILSECLYVHKKQRRGLCFCGIKAKQTIPELKFSTTGSKKY